MRAKLGLKPEDKVVLTVGRLASTERLKGYDEGIQAMARVCHRIPNARYVLAGKGDDMERLREVAHECGLGDRLIMPGFIAEEDIVPLFNACDLFILPSRKEGFGIVFLEAMGCGKPVIGGNRDGSMDPLCDGKLGTAVDPEDVEALSEAILAHLEGRMPPERSDPASLRAESIDRFGFKRFRDRLAEVMSTVVSPWVDLCGLACSNSHALTRGVPDTRQTRDPSMLRLLPIFCIVFVVIYLLPLGSRPIVTPDESRYGAIPAEMLSTGEFVAPRLNGIRYFEKPVLGYWAIAASQKIFGKNAWAIRLPSALSMGFAALCLVLLSRRLKLRPEAGWLAALIYITMLGVVIGGGVAILDAMFTGAVTGAIVFFYMAWTCAHARLKGWMAEPLWWILWTGLPGEGFPGSGHSLHRHCTVSAVDVAMA